MDTFYLEFENGEEEWLELLKQVKNGI